MGQDRVGPHRPWNGLGNLERQEEEPLEDFPQESDMV